MRHMLLLKPKCNDVLFDLKQIQGDLNVQIHILRDKENDPI
jgi:hypothetical protein